MITSNIIPYDLAAECVAEYQKIYLGDDLEAIHSAYTEGVSFSYVAVNEFMASASAAAGCDILETKLGVYTENFVALYPKAKLGRLSVFLYTKGHGLGDPPYDSLNNGALKP